MFLCLIKAGIQFYVVSNNGCLTPGQGMLFNLTNCKIKYVVSVTVLVQVYGIKPPAVSFKERSQLKANMFCFVFPRKKWSVFNKILRI